METRSALITDEAAKSLGFKPNENKRYIYVYWVPNAEYYNTPYINKKTNNSVIHKNEVIQWQSKKH